MRNIVFWLDHLYTQTTTKLPRSYRVHSMEFLGQSITWSSASLIAVLGLLTLVAWRRYFPPISDIPGPFAASFTRLWHMKRILKGDQNLELIRLHDKHGT